jgi:lysophospholipase L1-like esterase
MKRPAYILLSIAMLQLGCLTMQAQKQVRVACIGNSITYGYLIHNREHNAYPAQLQTMLGKGYEVLNFGSSGKTVLHAGGSPYIATKQYRDALNSKANIIFIKLGTNDSRPYYRKYIDSFYADYKALVHSFKALPNHPRVILLIPVVNFLGKKPDEAYCTDIPKFIMPVIKRVADEEKCKLVDLHPLLIDHPEMYPDKLHPDSAGAAIIAKRLYNYLKN